MGEIGEQRGQEEADGEGRRAQVDPGGGAGESGMGVG
jgi:hypothetical protein